MQFDVGQSVHVASLGKGVVREVRNGARYLVEIKGRTILVAAVQLRAVAEAKSRKNSAAGASPRVAPSVPHRRGAPSSVDLHGMTVVEATFALDEFLSEAILSGHAEVRVIHGRSGVRLRDAVHRRLKLLRSVRAYRLDPSNPGVTIVAL